MKISLLHPFSAKAIGLTEKDLLSSHSKTHLLALQAIREIDKDFNFSVDYFTGSLFKKQRVVVNVLKRFWPISSRILNRHQWRKQFSATHYKLYETSPPEITVINMSGHGSPYIFKLAKKIREKNKNYIAMIGGLNMTYDGAALHYYENAHHILVHTLYQKNDLIKREVFSKLDIRVLPLGIDTSIFKPSKRTFEKDYVITYVGRISRLKQVELAVEALAFCIHNGLKNVTLNIIGPKSDTIYFKELKALCVKHNCQDAVHFLGFVAHNDLINYYQNSTILTLPSKHESFGMVMTEAMACGIPVVALKGAGGPDEIITDGIDGILTNKEFYANQVFMLLSDKKRYLNMSENARKKVVEKFSLVKTIEVFYASLKSVSQ